MNKKVALYVIVPVLGVGLLTAGIASAHSYGGMGRGFGGMPPEDFSTRQQDMFEHQAEMFGLNIDDVKNAWADGKSMKQLAEEKGIDMEQIHATLLAQREEDMKTRLQTMVDTGIISQDQATRRIQFMKDHPNERGGMMGGRGFRAHQMNP